MPFGDAFWRRQHNEVVDEAYKSRWVWYHTLLAIELAVVIALLCVVVAKL